MDETDLLRSLTSGMGEEERGCLERAIAGATALELAKLRPLPAPAPVGDEV